MFVRCAYFEGDVDPADRGVFDGGYRDIVAPTMATFPHVLHVRLLWGREFESPERQFYLVVEHGYEKLEHIAIALKSDARAGLQGTLDEIMPLFNGRIYHVNHEVTLFGGSVS